jgi:hypothetical protein
MFVFWFDVYVRCLKSFYASASHASLAYNQQRPQTMPPILRVIGYESIEAGVRPQTAQRILRKTPADSGISGLYGCWP